MSFVHPQSEALKVLRGQIAAALAVNPVLVGGWEVSAQAQLSVAVYVHSGDIMAKPGGALAASKDELMILLNVRGGPLAEAEALTFRDAIATIAREFTHPLVAGVTTTRWTFDIRGQGTFDNVLTVSGQVAWVSRLPSFPAPTDGSPAYDPSDRFALIKEMVLNITQEPI